MGAPRSFHVPRALCTPTFGPKVTLDDLEPIVASSSPAAPWATSLLATENAKVLDALLGEDTRLPRGVLATVADSDEGEVVTGLLNYRGEVWRPTLGWQATNSVGDTIDLSDADVAFIARAFTEGADRVIMRSSLPLAFISAAAPPSNQSAPGMTELPSGSVVVAIVDALDKDAVLEMLAVSPGPKVYRRHDGSWQEDPAWINVLASVRPPTMVKLEPGQIEGVAAQVDQATTGQPFEMFKEAQRGRYQSVTGSAYVAELRAEAEQRAVAMNLALVAVAGRELSPKDAASTEKLRRYWLYGKGAAKIRWGTPGAWRRCYRNLVKYLGPRMTPGYCTNLSQRLGGQGVATHVGRRGAVGPVDWDPNLHPRGKDGKFIEVLGLVDLIGMHGFQHGQRGHKNVQGQVTAITPDPNKPGDPIITVKVTDPRWDASQFGETIDVRSDKIIQRMKPKGDIGDVVIPPNPEPSPIPKKTPSAKTPKVAPGDIGAILPRTPTPNMTPSPDSPNLAQLKPPADWETMGPEGRLAWLTKTMEADYAEFRGKPTTFDFTGMDSGIAFNLANAYRDLTNWDPETAKRIDAGILSSVKDPEGGLGFSAIAVAHPGTAHPGGIGPKIKDSAIVLKDSYFSNMDFWLHEQAQSANHSIPWSSSSKYGDPTITLIHEFGHQRQFRFLDVAMREVGTAWSEVVRDDGFGLVPDSSNWQETQAIRYEIPKVVPTQYGHSKSSEGFAEAWATRLVGDSSPELDKLLDDWDAYMGLPLMLPPDRYPSGTKNFDYLTPEERDAYWESVGPVLMLPGMREHYPETAAAYDAWAAQPAMAASAVWR